MMMMIIALNYVELGVRIIVKKKIQPQRRYEPMTMGWQRVVTMC